MSFDTLTFWIFFAIAWTLWRYLPFRAAKAVTLLASLIFYGWWNPWYLPLIAFSAVVDYLAGGRIHRSEVPWVRKSWLAVSLVCNLGLLAVFKYEYFFVESWQDLLGEAVNPADTLRLWVVPVGISFYTFQTLSYSLDIYRRRLRPAASFLDFFLFVSFFPQLVAGPIVRAGELLPQFRRRRRLSASVVQMGAYCIVSGLFLKMVIADNLALAVDRAYDPVLAESLSCFQAWQATIFFAAQIYADFAGYSLIAIGLAYVMGLRFPRNFRYPYMSAGLSEFWTRWHITLSEWLRDYLYISLGGNRGSSWRTSVNLLVTMLLGGLWHGASWTFVVWGGLHGAGLCVERAWMRMTGATGSRHLSVPRTWGARGWRLVRIGVVFLFVCLTWVFFRAESFAQAGHFFDAMMIDPFRGEWGVVGLNKRMGLVALVVFGMHGLNLLYEWAGWRQRKWIRVIATGVMLTGLIIVRRATNDAFLYFQF